MSGKRTVILLAALCCLVSMGYRYLDWGFYAHRLINRMAVFTLPPEMMSLYKPYIGFVSTHAVDPDKRRYASRYEAVRHYLDLDSWGAAPFDTLPRTWLAAMIKFADLEITFVDDTRQIVHGQGLYVQAYTEDSVDMHVFNIDKQISSEVFRMNYAQAILPGYYEDDWIIAADSFRIGFGLDHVPPWKEIQVTEHFTEHGIAPYHLVAMQRKLTGYFLEGDFQRIIQCSADFGHYIGDAHVPLHTTKNYNGQLTDQLGIHAFWESRIPELFAEKEYDFLAGKAEYIEDPVTYYWDIVLASHVLVDSVLDTEKELSRTYPSDQQYCFDERLDNTVRLQCRDYAKAYQSVLGGMVEDRMRASIHAIGSAWYTAWVDAGQPHFGYAKPTEFSDLGDQTPLLQAESQAGIRKHE